MSRIIACSLYLVLPDTRFVVCPASRKRGAGRFLVDVVDFARGVSFGGVVDRERLRLVESDRERLRLIDVERERLRLVGRSA